MVFNKFNVRRIATCALMTFASGTALADDVTLTSADRTVNLVGELVDFSDGNYVIRTDLGDLRIAASRVRCEGAVCPALKTAEADVRIAGSDTIGLGMMTLLISGHASNLNAEASVVATQTEGQITANLVSDDGLGDKIGSYLVTSTSSNDAFTTLLNGSTQVGMSSRRIRPSEAQSLRDSGAGDMVSTAQEHIIAVDSLVVITHPNNPIEELSLDQLRAIYSGEITNWSDLGGADAQINIISLQDGSDTRSMFEDRIFGNEEATLVSSAVIAEDNSKLTAMVKDDPNALGFVGYAFQRGAKALTLVNECGISMTPDAFSAKTEEYALQRRLYLYNRGDALDVSARDFIDYTTSSDANDVIAEAGFIDLGVTLRDQPLDGDRARALLAPSADAYQGGVMYEMLSQMIDYDRLSTTFRFQSGSSRLDERGQIDMTRLTDFLEDQPAGTKIKFVGFTDVVGAFDSNRTLSVRRAKRVMAQFQAAAGDRIGSIEMDFAGFGELVPSACNVNENGRALNRRVEVWINAAAI
jgi:phosphate transport system substrate-binding protein